MRKFLLTAAVLALVSTAALTQVVPPVGDRDDDGPLPPPPPPPARFRPWQQAWQCNDIRVTITGRDPYSVEYDLGGTIWGGSRFTVVKGALYFNGRPCLPLQPVGY